MLNALKKTLDPSVKVLKKAKQAANQVVMLEDSFKQLSDEELQAKTAEFKARIENGETLDSLLIEAFATVREAATRVLGMTPYPVQMMGAYILHGGNIAEMRTGEGKTLTGTMPVYLNALTGKGVHVVTVNEYLSARDAQEMGELYRWLGLSVGLNRAQASPVEKQKAYACDILYTTNSELGFDYLRDHMVKHPHQRVQRELNYALIDETDSILVDEARTPLIISGGEKSNKNLYVNADKCAKALSEEVDFTVDKTSRAIMLTEEGINKSESFFGIENLYDLKHGLLLHHIQNALKANWTFANQVDYVVQEGEVKIVDPFTGRIMEGRSWSNGLHQAVEAKEGVQIKPETQTVATITYQNFFRLYQKLSGMTGTAKTEEEEFRNIYNIIVVEVPTHRPIARLDAPDLMYRTLSGKYAAVVQEVKDRHTAGQPILLGTVAIETSEIISGLLHEAGIEHEVLNAKNHEREADIIKNAGQRGAVTIATNMAGRGTDIKLGDGVHELGGLAVIGTERHESRRIDNQLRGRSGRQGDPGYSRFYLSFEDELMRRFGSERILGALDRLGFAEDEAIESKMVSKSVESAQRQVEGSNYDSRKTLLEYDGVVREQRELIYEQREKLLVHESPESVIETFASRLVDRLLEQSMGEAGLEVDYLLETLNTLYVPQRPLTADEVKSDGFADWFVKASLQAYEGLPDESLKHVYRGLLLSVIDSHWANHIDVMDGLRQGIHLRSYGQINPLLEYQQEGRELFDLLLERIESDAIRALLNLTFHPVH